MILKGSQRGGGQGLAVHLMRTDENEHVEVHELRGFAADDLPGAFKEAQAVSRATRCRQFLFSLSLNPPETENVSVATFEAAIDRVEEKLGLQGQPRAVVFHEKEGRRHAHCVWSRIDAETMTARQMSFFKTRLSEVSRELYLENDWKMPRGLTNSSLRDPANYTLAEWQQAKRAGHDARAFKDAVQDAWAISDGRGAFASALKERGLWLARGDRRGHVLLDHTGEVYGLARTLGLKTKEVRARIGDEAALPSVSDTRQRIADEMSPVLRRHIDDARASWRDLSATLAFKKVAVRDRQRIERQSLKQMQQQRADTEAKARAARLPKGFKGIWLRIKGRYSQVKRENEQDALACKSRDASEREALVFRHLGERRKLQAQVRTHRSQQAKLLLNLRDDRRAYERLRTEPQKERRSKDRGPR
jgi:hypothetical protein